jgi:hypothetical protein
MLARVVDPEQFPQLAGCADLAAGRHENTACTADAHGRSAPVRCLCASAWALCGRLPAYSRLRRAPLGVADHSPTHGDPERVICDPSGNSPRQACGHGPENPLQAAS